MLIDEINDLHIKHFGKKPNLSNPKTYNEKIKWLMLNDQSSEQIAGCDKAIAREIAPESARIPILHVGQTIPDLLFPFVAKASHDSGTVFIVKDKNDLRRAGHGCASALKRIYAIGKGEWAYRLVPPQIVCEQYIPQAGTDYKFHCVHGEVKWIQVITNRGQGTTRETILMPDGSVSDKHMDEKMIHDPDKSKYPGDTSWQALSGLAIFMSQNYRYVRVDLYWDGENALFGELTYWPRAGSYKSKDMPFFDELMTIDTSYKLPRIVK